MDYWQYIEKFYSKKGVFKCKVLYEKDKFFEIEPEHLFLQPVSVKLIDKLEKKIKQKLPLSYKKFFSIINGGIFFSQKRTKYFNSGFVIYSAQEVCEYHKEVLKWLKGLFDTDSHLFEEGEKDRIKVCKQWMKNILVIGEELNSGNYLAIDFNCKKEGLEPPIIFLDHENPFSNVEDDEPILAQTIDELLYIAAKDPVAFLMEKLGATATYSLNDEAGRPVEFRLIDNQ